MAPTFGYEKAVQPPTDVLIPQNGYDYAWKPPVYREAETPYSPVSTSISRDMGAVPGALVQLPDRIRGDHPRDSFSAVGPLARPLIGGQTSTDIYAPLRKLAEHGGYVVLIGVGLARMTLLHEAERLAGRNLFWRWVKDKDGETVSVRVGGCSEGFEALAPALAGLERTHRVG